MCYVERADIHPQRLREPTILDSQGQQTNVCSDLAVTSPNKSNAYCNSDCKEEACRIRACLRHKSYDVKNARTNLTFSNAAVHATTKPFFIAPSSVARRSVRVYAIPTRAFVGGGKLASFVHQSVEQRCLRQVFACRANSSSPALLHEDCCHVGATAFARPGVCCRAWSHTTQQLPA